MARVVLENLTKRFDGVIAVRDFTLDIADGEFLVLVGPSGCGKSTTLRMVAGLEEITEGTIRIGDRVVNDLPPKDRDIAMVFQNYALYPHMSVYDNMAFGLKLRKLPKAQIDQRVKVAAEMLGIHHLLHRKPRALSGGQRQRVAVGRAIVRNPAVFLFDEPLSNLDAKLRVQMRVELKKLHQQLKTTAIYVTHDQVEAMTMGDRIVVMRDGLIQQVGNPLEVYAHPRNRFVAGFIGSPPMNFLQGILRSRNGGTFLEASGFRLRIPQERHSSLENYIGQQVTFGLRPEDIFETQSASSETIAATVEVVEPLGSEILLDVRVGDDTLVARVAPRTHIRPHQIIDLAFSLDKMHFFDPETEEAIG
ncbi:MAG: ABC transporter ATP-binding protein [Candidatus Methylomirabilales bacterium]